MRDCEVREVPVLLECQRLTADSTVRICLPGVYKKRKRSYAKAAQKVLAVLVMCVFRLVVSAALTIPCAIYLMKISYAERGYLAYGGEWFAIIGFFILMLRITRWVVRSTSKVI